MNQPLVIWSIIHIEPFIFVFSTNCRGMHLTETLQVHMEVQRRLQDQLEVCLNINITYMMINSLYVNNYTSSASYCMVNMLHIVQIMVLHKLSRLLTCFHIDVHF